MRERCALVGGEKRLSVAPSGLTGLFVIQGQRFLRCPWIEEK